MQDLNTYIQEQLEKSQDAGFTCVEAEENILRRMILRQGVAEESVMDLQPQDFSDPEYAKVYRAIQSLIAKQRQIDLVSLDAEMTVLYGDGWRPDVLIDLTRQRDYTVAKWQDIKGFALYTAATGGTMIYYGKITNAEGKVSVDSGAVALFDPGALKISIASTDVSE